MAAANWKIHYIALLESKIDQTLQNEKGCLFWNRNFSVNFKGGTVQNMVSKKLSF